MVCWRAFVCFVGSLTLVAGCSRKPATVTPVPVETNGGASIPTGNSASATPDPGASPASGDELSRTERIRAVLLERIHFGYDRADLSAEAQQILQGKLSVLREVPDARIRIEGHADERGSDQYNVVLGQQRAAAVKRYLVAHGIGESRLEIISFGEERPVCQAENEACWMQNRRAEFQILGGVDRR